MEIPFAPTAFLLTDKHHFGTILILLSALILLTVLEDFIHNSVFRRSESESHTAAKVLDEVINDKTKSDADGQSSTESKKSAGTVTKGSLKASARSSDPFRDVRFLAHRFLTLVGLSIPFTVLAYPECYRRFVPYFAARETAGFLSKS